MTKVEFLKELAKEPILLRRIIQPVQNRGVLNLGSSGYQLPLDQYELAESCLSENLVTFRKSDLAGGDYFIEEVWCEPTSQGLLYLQGELAREAMIS